MRSTVLSATAAALLWAASLSSICTSARAGTGGAPGAPVAGSAGGAGYRPGEGFAFTFSVGAIDAGRARMSVGQPTMPASAHGRRLLGVQGDAHSAPWLSLLARLDDDYKVVLDADALAPDTIDTAEHGIRERKVAVRIDRTITQARVKLDLVKGKQEGHETRIYQGVPVDPVGALFTMRAAPLRDGDVLDMLAFEGPAFYRTQVKVAGREAIERSGVKETAIRLDVSAQRVDEHGIDKKNEAVRHATIWLSDDARRIPYRIAGDTDFGRCELELVSYREGKAAPKRRARQASASFPVEPVVLRPPPQ